VIGLKLSQVRGLFFDRMAVLAATTSAERRVLSRFGAFVRQRARTSMKRRSQPAAPGQPPSAHTGLLRQHLYFAWDPFARSVVIGPVLLNQKQGAIPPLLEYGGPAVRVRWGKPRRVVYAPRPYMRPAFAAEQARLPTLWRGSVR
jgi:hypothetical protein